MQKQETRPNTQYENMIQYQIRKVVIDPPKTQDLIFDKKMQNVYNIWKRQRSGLFLQKGVLPIDICKQRLQQMEKVAEEIKFRRAAK